VTGPDWGWWRDRRPPQARLHLDTAAAGRSSRAILAAAAAHAEREAQTGGYVAAAEAEPVPAASPAPIASSAPGQRPAPERRNRDTFTSSRL
jgi:hypothetical protein